MGLLRERRMVDKGDVAWMFISTVLVTADDRPRPRAVLRRPGPREEHPLGVDAGPRRRLARAGVVGRVRLLARLRRRQCVDRGFGKAMLAGVGPSSTVPTFTQGVVIPELAYVAFQGAFAAISCALVVGAIAERAKFAAVLLFAALWFTFAYLPLAHMVWAGNGFLFKLGALDFAGGTVVHINAGVAGLVGAYMLGPRIGFGRERLSPHNLPLTYVGASLLWVGWFGFNAGSALEANGVAALAFVNTLLAAAAAVLVWSAIEATTARARVDVGCGLRRGRGIGRDHAGVRHRRRRRRDGDRRVRWRGWILGRQCTQAPFARRRFARRLRHPWRLRHRRRGADGRVHRAGARRNGRARTSTSRTRWPCKPRASASRSCGRASSHSSHSRSPNACAACAWTTTASAKAWTSAPMANRRTKSDSAAQPHRRRPRALALHEHPDAFADATEQQIHAIPAQRDIVQAHFVDAIGQARAIDMDLAAQAIDLARPGTPAAA